MLRAGRRHSAVFGHAGSGRLRLVALIEEAAVISRILSHLGLAIEIPRAVPARPPPDDVADFQL